MTMDIIAAVAGRLLQSGRLLRSHFPHGDGPGAVLVVNTLNAQEKLSRCFRFDVELLSDDASVPLKEMIGKMMTVSLLRDNGTERHFNGYITEFRNVKTDGGFVHYAAVLEPWLAFARLRKDCVSFKGRSVTAMTELTFALYEQHDWKACMSGEDPEISYMNQYNETDYNHLHRRWEAAGFHYWYEHRIDGHTLWLSDDSTMASLVETSGDGFMEPGTIPYRAYAGSAEGDGIRQWQAVRRVGSGATALASFDYKKPTPYVASRESENRQGADVPPYELYEDAGAYGYSDGAVGEALARRRMEEADRITQYFEAAGNDRSVLPGRSFLLADHFSATMRWAGSHAVMNEPIGKREYLIVSARHRAGNNLHASDREPSYYDNEITCLRKTIRWRPGRNHNSTPPPAPGVQTAIVTGPPGEEIYTDGYGRVKVQLHWDRLGERNENSSAWVRVAMPMAGGQLGQIGMPRVGQEVVVQFMGNNPDRPIVTGVVYNERNQAPWQLPGQRALSGLRSRELGGSRGNQLVLDDTNGQIQAQLRSDHLHSQLSLGQIHRLESNDGHAEARGEGFELRSDGHGVVRAGQGLLITTESGSGSSDPVKELAESVQRLVAAAEIQEQLAKVARHYEAQETAQQDATVEDLDAQTSAIRGAGKSSFPELSEPHVVVSSPAGIELTSGQSTHIASKQHTAITSGKNLSIASLDGLFASVGKTFRLFVHKAGMKLVAAAGKVSVQAQSDDVEVIANKVLKLLSETDWVEIRAKKGIRLHGANNMLEIGEKVQFFTGSPVLFNGNLETLAPKSVSQSFNERPQDCKFDQEVNFVHVNGKPADGVSFELIREDDNVSEGKSAKDGSTGVQNSTGIDSYTIRWKGELP